MPGLVGGRLAFELRLTWLGGTRILERIEEMGYDTLNARPKISTADKIVLLVKSLWKQMNCHRDTETQRG